MVSEGRRSPLIEQVDLVSSVSGGSVTAAYFALKGSGILHDFRKKFLTQDVEASLRTSVNLPNIVRLTSGALNESARLQSWFDEDRKSTRLNSSHANISY